MTASAPKVFDTASRFTSCGARDAAYAAASIRSWTACKFCWIVDIINLLLMVFLSVMGSSGIINGHFRTSRILGQEQGFRFTFIGWTAADDPRPRRRTPHQPAAA